MARYGMVLVNDSINRLCLYDELNGIFQVCGYELEFICVYSG